LTVYTQLHTEHSYSSSFWYTSVTFFTELCTFTLIHAVFSTRHGIFNACIYLILYYPLIAREEYVQEETSSFLSRLFKGKVAPMIAGFANQNELSKEDIDELKAVIKQWEKNND
jgi:hypothetical protein